MKNKALFILFIIGVMLFSCKKQTSIEILSGPVGTNDNRQVGASAGELLSATSYVSLVVELQYSPGMQLQPQTLINLQDFLEQRLHKPGGIVIQSKQVGSIGKQTVTTSDIAAFTDQNRKAYTDGNRITVYVYMLHEIGHILGLVNNGAAMVTAHEDGDNRAHCTNTNCLMYYTIETTGLMNMLNNNIPQLDANCINDLRASGGK